VARRKQSPREIRVRLRPGQDGDLLAWWEQLDDQPYGVKSQAIKEALRRGIGRHPRELGATSQSTTSAPVLDLAGLRQVVEAAVAQALARFEGQMGAGAAAPAPSDDDETEALLDNLGAALVVADEE
jgi:hypothetical protein